MIRIIFGIIVLGLVGCGAPPQGRVESGHWVCDDKHPRCKTSNYAYPQFSNSTNIGDFAGYSDVLEAGPKLEHYQTFLAELETQRPGTNAVALWGDAASIVKGGLVWGGFLSARSGSTGEPDFDSQLIGLEIDVLNAGLPGVYPNASKVGLQIVGFGAPNTNAIEILTQSPKHGQWHNGFNVQPGSISKDGAVIGIGRQSAAIGLNLYGSTFSDSAVIVSPDQRITFRAEGQYDAAVYRDSINDGHLVLQAGPAGLRIANAANDKNLVTITPEGDVVTDAGSLKDLSERIVDLERRLAALER